MQRLEEVFVRLKLTSESAASSCLVDRQIDLYQGNTWVCFFFPSFSLLQENSFPLHWRDLLLGLDDINTDLLLLGFQSEKHLASNKHWTLLAYLCVMNFKALK